jgi:hypothetical protein
VIEAQPVSAADRGEACVVLLVVRADDEQQPRPCAGCMPTQLRSARLHAHAAAAHVTLHPRAAASPRMRRSRLRRMCAAGTAASFVFVSVVWRCAATGAGRAAWVFNDGTAARMNRRAAFRLLRGFADDQECRFTPPRRSSAACSSPGWRGSSHSRRPRRRGVVLQCGPVAHARARCWRRAQR